MTTAADLLTAAATCMICGQPHPERQIKGLGRVFRTRDLNGHQPRPLDPAVLASLRGLAAKLERVVDFPLGPIAAVATWPPTACAYEEDFCKQGTVPSSYVGCLCWFLSHGGEFALDGIHCGRPPEVDGRPEWNPKWPEVRTPATTADATAARPAGTRAAGTATAPADAKPGAAAASPPPPSAAGDPSRKRKPAAAPRAPAANRAATASAASPRRAAPRTRAPRGDA